MERKALHKLPLVIVVVVSLLGLNPHLALAADTDDDERPGIAGIQTKPEGQTYGRWAAEWWQWVLGIPAVVNPLTDTTGEDCAQRQVDTVWFLAGSPSSDPVVRNCEIPAAKSLFFPLINNFFGAFLNDLPETRTEEFVREAGRCTEPAQISVEIDGFKVPRPLRFFTGASGSQSPIFNVQLPPGNVFGVDETMVPDPSAEQGYYLFVRPLSRGSHTIRWIASGCVPGLRQDITYTVTVAPSESGETPSKNQSALAVCGLEDGTVEPDADLHACAPDNSQKTTICHVPPGNPACAQTLCVANSAVKAHLANHSDSLGSCRAE